MPPRSHHKDHPSPAKPSDDYCCVSLQCPPGPSPPLCSLDQLPGFHEGVGNGPSPSTQPALQISVEVLVGFLTSPEMSVSCHLPSMPTSATISWSKENHPEILSLLHASKSNLALPSCLPRCAPHSLIIPVWLNKAGRIHSDAVFHPALVVQYFFFSGSF